MKATTRWGKKGRVILSAGRGHRVALTLDYWKKHC